VAIQAVAALTELTCSEAVAVELEALGFLAVAGETEAGGAEGVRGVGTLYRTSFSLNSDGKVSLSFVCYRDLDFERVCSELDGGRGESSEVQPLHYSTFRFVRRAEFFFKFRR
jgi:hypothetical protein